MTWIFTYFAYLALCFLNSFVLMMFWKWYIASIGLPVLSYSQSFGIVLIVGLLTEQYIPKRSDEEAVIAFFWMFASPVLIFIAGWSVHFFV